MRQHLGCVTDPLTRRYWKDFQALCREGNPLGLSFVEYVAHRVLALGQHAVSDAPASPWYVSECGHKHPWGESCATVTLT